MKNTKIYLVAVCMMLLSFSAYSQLDRKIADENVIPGAVIKDGKEIHGYIRRIGTTYLDESLYSTPWEFQKDIRFMEKEAFAKAEKIKNKDYTKYEAGDIEGYKYNGDSLTFESVKYADMSAVGTGMITKKMFMRKVGDGKITMFFHYGQPLVVGELSAIEASYEESAVPNYVYRIGKEGKLKLVNSLNVEKELADCPAVVEKYQKGDYGVAAGEEKRSSLAKLADKTIARDGIRISVIADYNEVCR